MDKEYLEQLIKEGHSYRDIEKITGMSNSNIQYLAKKYDLTKYNQHIPLPPYKFGMIDTPAKAYVLGFILCDAGINEYGYCTISQAMKDACVVEFIASIIGGEVKYDYTFDKKRRIFPKAILHRKISDVLRFIGGPKKENRHFPRIRWDLERFLVMGLFDADGCITWGRRKDRNRLWHKITIKSSYNILYGLQMFMYNRMNMITRIYPVNGENCFALEFANKPQVLYFIDWLYRTPDFVVLPRKYQKACALRLELEENGGVQTRADNTVPHLQSREV